MENNQNREVPFWIRFNPNGDPPPHDNAFQIDPARPRGLGLPRDHAPDMQVDLEAPRHIGGGLGLEGMPLPRQQRNEIFVPPVRRQMAGGDPPLVGEGAPQWLVAGIPLIDMIRNREVLRVPPVYMEQPPVDPPRLVRQIAVDRMPDPPFQEEVFLEIIEAPPRVEEEPLDAEDMLLD